MYSVLWKCIVFDACHKVVTGEWELEGFTKKKLEVFDASPSPSPPPGKRRRASAAAATGQGASSANAAPLRIIANAEQHFAQPLEVLCQSGFHRFSHRFSTGSPVVSQHHAELAILAGTDQQR